MGWVQAMFTVATEGLKKPLDRPDAWSEDFRKFLGACLQFDPRQRALPKELLVHSFIRKAENEAYMQKLFESVFLSNTLTSLGTGF